MDLHVISIFPDMFSAMTEHGVIGRAIKQNVLSLTLHNPRDYADDKHNTVDGRPYGGGPGMVMMPEPMVKVIEAAKAQAKPGANVIYLSPQGKRFDHAAAQEFAERDSVIFLAGRYEGIDERVLEHHVDEEWSIGDFVLSGGELPAMVMIDAIARLLPDSLGNSESAQQDSFAQGILDCPHYARPEIFAGQKVPDVLLSGNHKAIAKWREQQALGRTWDRRPELLEMIELTVEQQRLLDEYRKDVKIN
ncbi:MAG: tRNA (guanine37-N1)-methyltransferase [Arenicella sp.]|jgi:tRNA (guanine37-N1)-methyltransferase